MLLNCFFVRFWPFSEPADVACLLLRFVLHLAFPQRHVERRFPVVGHMPFPHLASPQLHVWRCFPVVGHMLLPHLASPQLHCWRRFPVVGHGRNGIKCCAPIDRSRR